MSASKIIVNSIAPENRVTFASMHNKAKQATSALRWLWDGSVIGSIAAILYGTGVSAMYGNDWMIASVLYFLAILLVTIKFSTWVDTKHFPYKSLTVSVAISFAFGLFGLSLWWAFEKHETPKKQSFHILAEGVVFNEKLPDQLIANIQIQNDGDDQEMNTQSVSAIGPTSDNTTEQDQAFEEIRQHMPNREGRGLLMCPPTSRDGLR